MANTEEKTRRVLKALLQCGKGPEFMDDCGDCPYLDAEEHCITRMAQEAYSVITTLDTTINAMLGNYGDSSDVEACDRKEGGD